MGRVRFAPEVASKPERLAKDLDNAKALVNVLEEQEEQLRKMKIISQPENGDGDPDTVMDAPDKVDEEEELPEKGSEAVARRIEKVMADLHDQNLVDASDEIAYETQKVGMLCYLVKPSKIMSSTIVSGYSVDNGCIGLVSCLSQGGISYLLLLRRRNGSCRRIAS